LVQISGFLGSGKTSAIIRMAAAAQKTGLSTAVIVNEIGDVDVDGEYVRSSGLKAKRILGGCICCSLGSDLVSTIKSVVDEFCPDVIFVEPTGVALPSQVKKYFLQASCQVPGLEFSPTVALVDGFRFRQLLSEFKDFLKKQARDAEIIAITKVDRVDRKFELPLIASALCEMRPGARVLSVSSLTGEGIQELLETVLGERAELAPAEGGRDDSVLSSGVGNADFYGIFRFDGPVRPDDMRALIADLLGQMGRRSVEETGRLVGHLKAYVESGGGGFKASLVDLSAGVEFSGDMPAGQEFRVSVFMALRGYDSGRMRAELEGKIGELSRKYGFTVASLHRHHP